MATERTMNVAFNRLWISNLNLRPYTLSILMWQQTKFKLADESTIRPAVQIERRAVLRFKV